MGSASHRPGGAGRACWRGGAPDDAREPASSAGVEEAGEWLRRELCSFTGAAGARSVALSRLADASARSSGDWGWLVELEFETAERARGATGGREWSRLVGDLRLLGMSPTVALVDGAEELAP